MFFRILTACGSSQGFYWQLEPWQLQAAMAPAANKRFVIKGGNVYVTVNLFYTEQM